MGFNFLVIMKMIKNSNYFLVDIFRITGKLKKTVNTSGFFN